MKTEQKYKVHLPHWLKNDPNRPNPGKTYAEYLDAEYGRRKRIKILSTIRV